MVKTKRNKDLFMYTCMYTSIYKHKHNIAVVGNNDKNGPASNWAFTMVALRQVSNGRFGPS